MAQRQILTLQYATPSPQSGNRRASGLAILAWVLPCVGIIIERHSDQLAFLLMYSDRSPMLFYWRPLLTLAGAVSGFYMGVKGFKCAKETGANAARWISLVAATCGLGVACGRLGVMVIEHKIFG